MGSPDLIRASHGFFTGRKLDANRLNSGLYQKSFIASLEQGMRPLLPHWGRAENAEVSLLCVSENATFRVDDPACARPLVIRVHRPGYHTRQEIASELAWIEAVIASGIVATPRPQRTRDGTLINQFEQAGQTRHVVAFEYVAGREPTATDELAAKFVRLGEISAGLHRQAQAWQRPQDFVRKTWNYDTTLGDSPHWGDWRDALGLDVAGQRLLGRCAERLRRELAAYGAGDDRFGLIHADLRLANLLVDGDRLTIIDFDDCGFCWYMYDFAAAISFFETSPKIPELKRAWVRGYRRVTELDAEHVQALDMFMMLRRMLLTAWLGTHSETPTAQRLGVDYTRDTVVLAAGYLQRTEGRGQRAEDR